MVAQRRLPTTQVFSVSTPIVAIDLGKYKSVEVGKVGNHWLHADRIVSIMTAKAEAASATPPPSASSASTIHEGERASGASGAIVYGIEIDLDSAIARRKNGEDVHEILYTGPV